MFFSRRLGAALFARLTTGLSVSYFDQAYLFLYLTLAAIGSRAQVHRVSAIQAIVAEVPVAESPGITPQHSPWFGQPPGHGGALGR